MNTDWPAVIKIEERTTRMESSAVEIWVLNYALLVMEQYGLIAEGWTIKFLDTNRENAGQVFHIPKLITFTREYIFDTRIENLRELVLHEVAHALCPNGDHTQEWRDKLTAIGGTGRWYLSEDFYREVKVDDPTSEREGGD